ncbi:MAG: formylglycine-generating enzyme family protein [Verrucomicrobia bacterium]|nr:formylglycine-generating enzyme family protein [Verrucomicrobiota bacterium]
MRRGFLIFPLITLLASLTQAGADQATAIATVFRGLVSGITVTHPGAGYTIAPSVRITGGNGSGAAAAAFVESGAVIQIIVTSAGSNYTAVPVVEIDPPASMEIDLVARLTVRGALGSVHEIQWAESLDDQAVWTHLTNVTLLTAQAQVVDLATPTHGHRYYRRVESGTHFPGMVFIPQGTFVMGSPASEKERDSAETQHAVILTKGFWMGQREVTQGEFLSVIGSNRSYFKNGVNALSPGTGGKVTNELRHPVEQVSWIDATNYCGKLTQRDRAAGVIPVDYAYRLPTEAEWEYACRGGTTNAFSFGTAIRQGMANFYTLQEYDSAVGSQSKPGNVPIYRTIEVGSYAPNAFGLYDMHGNVWEWCSDWYGNYPTGVVTDPVGPTSGDGRVIRGGHWGYSGRDCRAARRYDYNPDIRGHSVGFRVVLAPGR